VSLQQVEEVPLEAEEDRQEPEDLEGGPDVAEADGILAGDLSCSLCCHSISWEFKGQQG
jgi:hypothetical protein